MPDYSAGTASVRLTPDASGFLRDAERKLRAISDPGFDVHVSPDLTRFRQELEQKLRDTPAPRVGIGVTADTTEAARQLAVFREEQARLPIRLGVDVDTGAATASLQAWRAAQELHRVTVEVHADTSHASNAISGLGGGGGRRGGRGGFGGLTGPVGINLGAAALGSLPAAATALTTVAGSLQQLTQAGLALPGVMAGVAASVGTAALGFKGMGDAVTALNEAAASGDPKDLQKAADALKDMAPNAVGVAQAISGLRPEFLGLQNLVQQNMFDGLDKQITDVSGRMLPTLRTGLGAIGTAWNQTFKELGRVGGSDSTLNIMDRIFGNTSEAQKRANAAIEPMVTGLGTLAAAGSDALPRLADGLTDVMNRLRDFVTAADADGRLDKWINDGITGVTNLGRTVLNIGKSFTALTSAAGGGGQFLEWLAKSTDRLQAFLNSAQGQETLRRFFAEGREQLAQLLPLLENLAEMFGGVYDAAKGWTAFLVPALTQVTNLLTGIPGGVEAVAFAFIAWKSMNGVSALLSSLSKVDGALTGIAGKAGRLGPAVGLLAGGSMVASSSDSGVGQTLGVLGAAGGGALAGSMFGPWGAAIGALGGTAAGVFALISASARESEEAIQAASDSTAAFEERMRGFADTMRDVRGLQGGVNDALLESGGQLDAAAVKRAVGQRVSALPQELQARLQDPKKADAAADAIESLGISNDQLVTTISGGQPLFDSLIANLTAAGPAGEAAADAIGNMRAQLLDAQGVAQTASGSLSTLAQNLGYGPEGVAQAAADVRTAFAGIPRDVPIDISTPNGQAVYDLLKQMNVEIELNPDGKTINTTAPLAPQVVSALEQITGLVVTNNAKTITVAVDDVSYNTAVEKLTGMTRNLTAVINPVVDPPAYRPGDAGSLILPGIPAPPKKDGGPTPSGRGPGPTGGWFAEIHSDEWILPAHARAAVGDQALWALTQGRSFAPGGFIDEHGNPVTPGPLPGPAAGADPVGGGIGSIADSFLSGIGGPAARIGGLLGAPAGADTAASDTYDGPKIIPGFLGLAQAGNDPDMLSQWGKQTGDWLGKFAGKTLLGFGTTLYKGLLGAVGLENSILSPDNELFRAAAASAGFYLGENGPFAPDDDTTDTGKTKAATDKQLREGSQKVDRADQKIAEITQRIAELPADAAGSRRTALDNDLANAKQDAADARADLAELRAKGTSTDDRLPANLPTRLGGEQGLQANTILLKRSIENQFPEITKIGGVRQDALHWHPDGLAIDVMIPGAGGLNDPTPPEGKALGDRIWAWAQAHAAEIGLDTSPGVNIWQKKDHYNHLHLVSTGGGYPTEGQTYSPARTSSSEHFTGFDGGHTPGSKYTPVAATLHGDEFVHRNAAVEKYGLDFMNSVNDLTFRPPEFWNGGAVADAFKTAAVVPPPAPKLPRPPKAIEMRPRAIPAPAAIGPPPPAAPAPAAAPPPPPAAVPEPQPPAASPPPAVAQQPPQQAPSFAPVAGGGASGGPAETDYTLDWIEQGIDSTAATLGNIAGTAAGVAAMGMGGGGGGGIGALVAGGIQQGGKIAKGIANVVSATMVGSVPGSFMTTPEAYGRTQVSEPRTPQTEMPAFTGRQATYHIQGVDTRNMLAELQLRENIEQQAALANHPMGP